LPNAPRPEILVRMDRVRHRPRFAALWLALAPAFAAAQDSPAPTPADQRDYADSPNGCGPATLLNLLKLGGPEYAPVLKSLVGATDGVKMRYLVDRHFRHRPSSARPGDRRWSAHGIECVDLVEGFNELLADHHLAPLAATYLDRAEDESEADHLARVHRLIEDSLAAGTPPVLSLRSFLVKRREENGGEPHWETGFHHYVLLTALRGTPSPAGFEIEAIDPWKARRTVLYLHREANGRAFRALKGNEDSGEWLKGQPFLQILAPEVPALRPANVEWSDRYLVIANHLIGRF